jgi:hypothetical protein
MEIGIILRRWTLFRKHSLWCCQLRRCVKLEEGSRLIPVGITASSKGSQYAPWKLCMSDYSAGIVKKKCNHLICMGKTFHTYHTSRRKSIHSLMGGASWQLAVCKVRNCCLLRVQLCTLIVFASSSTAN